MSLGIVAKSIVTFRTPPLYKCIVLTLLSAVLQNERMEH